MKACACRLVKELHPQRAHRGGGCRVEITTSRCRLARPQRAVRRKGRGGVVGRPLVIGLWPQCDHQLTVPQRLAVEPSSVTGLSGSHASRRRHAMISHGWSASGSRLHGRTADRPSTQLRQHRGLTLLFEREGGPTGDEFAPLPSEVYPARSRSARPCMYFRPSCAEV